LVEHAESPRRSVLASVTVVAEFLSDLLQDFIESAVNVLPSLGHFVHELLGDAAAHVFPYAWSATTFGYRVEANAFTSLQEST